METPSLLGFKYTVGLYVGIPPGDKICRFSIVLNARILERVPEDSM